MYGVPATPGQGMVTGDYATACPELEQAVEVDPAPAIYFNLGVCLHEWSKTVGPPDRLELLRRALRAFQQTLEAEGVRPDPREKVVDAVEIRIREIEAALDELEQTAATPPPPSPGSRTGGAASCQCEVGAGAPEPATRAWWLGFAALAWMRRRRRPPRGA